MVQVQEKTARTPMQVEVRKAQESDIPELAKVLARAFNDDPFLNWFVRQDSRRDERFEKAFNVALRQMSRGLADTYTTTDLAGGAIWRAPGESKIGMLETLKLIIPYASVTGWSGLKRFVDCMNVVDKRHEHHAGDPHWYLFILGVDTVHQGRGVGGQLIAPMLARCDEEKTPAYLETATERNLPFYERHGFKVVEEIVPVATAPTVWLMRREPR
jgi:ribosomal protein S18 acetylase RimI-like enzyme